MNLSFAKPFLAAVAMCTFSALAQAPGDVRVALVIGNSSYAGAPLVNPANDAKAMGETLRGIGFTVIELRDGSKAQMAEAVGKIGESLKGKQGVGMLYYAGHGLQMDARNFMVPVDANISKAADVPTQTVDVGSVIQAFKSAGTRMNIVVLDACRDNPFGGITTGKGLAPLDAPSGTFLAYATAPGNVAGDGDAKSGNGLYTQYLLEELKKPQAGIESMFKRVRFAVRKASNGQQIPWESTSLEDDFQFNDGKVVAVARPTQVQRQAEFGKEKLEWERIKDSASVDDVYAFLQKYPGGPLAEVAHARLNFLNTPALVVQGGAADGGSAPYVPARHRLGDQFTMQAFITETGSARKDRNGRPSTMKVEAIKGDEVTIQEGSGFTKGETIFHTLEGAELGTSTMRHLPLAHAPAGPLQPGQRWNFGYDFQVQGLVVTLVGEGRVMAREKVTVAAGTYDTFKIRRTMTISTPTRPDLTKTTECNFWITSSLPVPVRMACPLPNNPFVPVTELMAYARGS
ncbi:MAG: caspase family protein [Pseudomonadota bacterium]